MNNSTALIWMRRITLLSVLLALFVVVLGAYVRLNDAGLGCPDWPGCYGHIDIPKTEAEIAKANADYPNMQVDQAKAWYEMVHRYFASGLGFLMLVIFGLAIFTKQHIKFAVSLVVLVIFQGMLGMLTVTLLLKPLVVMSHLLGGMTLLSLLWWFYLRQSHPKEKESVQSQSSGIKKLAIITTAVLGLQIALGGWTSTNYAATACPDFPMCQGQIWPDDMDFKEGFVMWRGLGINYEGGVLRHPAEVAIHFTHRLWAIVATFFILLLGGKGLKHARQSKHPYARQLKYSSIAMKTALLTQLAVAIAMIKLAFPLGVSTAHNGFAALLLLATVSVLYFSRHN